MPEKDRQEGRSGNQGAGGQNSVIPFMIDKKPQKISPDQNPVSGSYLYGLGVPEGYDLLLRARGQGDDVEIQRGQSYDVEPGDYFYTAKSVLTPGWN